MQIRIGVDLVLVSRVAELAEDGTFLERTFHPSEMRDPRPEHLAGVFAAKEALFKALGTPSRWLEAEVQWDSSGRPGLRVADESRRTDILSLDVSISHEGEYAVAAVAALLSGEDQDASQNLS